MRIAIVGTGVSGLVCAHRLHPHHDVTCFEAADRIGGHAHTVRVDLADETHQVDCGFIVYNETNYPVFTSLLAELGVATRPSDMSLSISDRGRGLEWGTNIRRLFAQRSNALSPSFYGLLREVLRWNRLGTDLLAHTGNDGATGTDRGSDSGTDSMPDGLADAALEPVGHFLARHRFSERFRRQYLVPLASALWSADPATIDGFPVVTMCRFLANHGMLSLGDRPAWRTITGGSQRYVTALSAPFADRIRTAIPVENIARHSGGVDLTTPEGTETFDRVVLATHSDQALGLLGDADRTERDILGAIGYQPNVATLHTDRSVLPTNRRAWASWNVSVPDDDPGGVTMTYHMNRLQDLESREEICVTLNRHDEIDPARVIARIDFSHPVYDTAAVTAQARQGELANRGGVTWCGAWLGYGFHEDGARSGVDAARSVQERR